MNEPRKKFQLKVKGNKLYWSRLNRYGERVGDVRQWTIRGKSNIPRGMFDGIHGALRQRVKGCESAGFGPWKRAAIDGLCEAALAMGCTVDVKHEEADVLYHLNGRPFFAFQIHNTKTKKRGRALNNSEAVFRWVIVISADGFPRIHTRKVKKIAEV